ncbi:probable helicase senataxin isoform X2 [Melanerpes formicivorus]|uniref:probable helicase senataxin isoform X2 n=1 Tax=Melanerpes formicivorus TaxID=211600 RepID=UPI00358F217A
MSTCRWCTLSGSDTTEFLKDYASNQLPLEDLEGSNDDLCYCLECVVEYHKARERMPRLHQVLWELETSRLIAHIEKSMQEEDEAGDELYLVDENGDTLLSGYVGPDFENNLRVPLLETLKYPYLLLHERVSELCVQALCRMEQSHSSFQVFEKYPGIYLFLVHPNEVIRRWAILTARSLGKVDRDDYYDLQEVLTCLFRVIELGLFESPDIYSSSMIEKGKLILLPSHLYDTTNYKNYWLGICMLLTVLEDEAMDSLLLGPGKQNDFMQSILHTMEKEGADDSTDPFWPALHCFMVILDQLGSKVWGQLIDPVQAFQTIINSVSYNNEIKNIRSSFMRMKCESEPDEDEEMITCSQIVYNYNTEKPQRDTGWKAAICPEYCPGLYEDMQTLASVLQSDMGREMRVHESTFLWFIPFVQSLMDLKDLGMAYIVEVIHYLCSEIKDTLNKRIQQCDKVAEFFLLILVSIIELHRNKKCLHLLWISSQEWVEVVVRSSKLPASAFSRRTDRAPGVRGSPGSQQASNSVQQACVQLIRSLLKEGYQIGQQALCKQYLNKLNLLLRGNLSLGWQLTDQETQELQVCLRQVIRSIKNRPLNSSAAAGNNASCPTLPAGSVNQEKSDDDCKASGHGRDDLSSPAAAASKEGGDGDCQESPFFRRKSAWEEECRDPSISTRCWTSTKGLLLIKKEPDQFPAQNSLATKLCRKVQETRADDHVAGKGHPAHQSLNPNAQCSDGRRGPELETQREAGPIAAVHLAAPPRVASHGDVHSSDRKQSNTAPSSPSKLEVNNFKLRDLKITVERLPLPFKMKQLAKPPDLRTSSAASASKAEADQPKLGAGYPGTSKACPKYQAGDTACGKDISVATPPLKSCESPQEESASSAFQTRVVPSKAAKKSPVDCSVSSRDEPALQRSGDLFSGTGAKKALRKASTGKKSHLPRQPASKPNSDMQKASGWKQPRLDDLVKSDCRGHVSEASCMKETSANGCVPSSSESKGDLPSPASQSRLLSVKGGASDRLLEFSEYFKRENSSVVEKEKGGVEVEPEDNSVTDSQVDRELSKLSLAAYAKGVNFPFESSQESSVHDSVSDVRRKVKGAVRFCFDGQSTKPSSEGGSRAIVISDSSSEESVAEEEEEPKEVDETMSLDRQPSPSSCASEFISPNFHLFLDECESQCFEFETDEDVHSVWSDTQAMEPTQEYKQDQLSATAGSSNSGDAQSDDALDHTIDWGYEVDYITDELMEEEVTLIEKQLGDASQQEGGDQDGCFNHMEKQLENTSHQEEGGHNGCFVHMEKEPEDTSHQEEGGHDGCFVHVEKEPEDTSHQEEGGHDGCFVHVEKEPEDPSDQEEGGHDGCFVHVEKEPEDPSDQEEGDRTKKATNLVLEESVSKGNVGDQLENVADKGPTVAQDFTLDSAEPRASTSSISLASKLALKKKSLSPRNSVAKHKVARTVQRSPKNPLLKAAQSKLLLNTSASQPGRSLPAVVPPKKVRQCPVPASTVEKLGLKKAPRKAFELSQRSLQSIVELRSHGKAAGRVGQPQKRKAKAIPAQTLSIKYNKKFLACQDFLRQTRPRKRAPEPLGGSESRNKVRRVDVKLKKPKPPSLGLAAGEGSAETQKDKGKKAVCPSEEPHASKLLCSIGSSRRSEDDSMMVPPVPTVSGLSSTVLVGDDSDKPSGKGCVVQPESEKTASTENGCEADEDSGDDDNLFLTQLDPEDMELCSQVESVEDITIGSKNPEEMNTAESLQQSEASAVVQCKHTDCVEKVGKPGEYCREHSASSLEGDHVFAIPLLPPPKPRKPSTAKIFSSASSSRSAAFSKDLEDGKKLPPASKSKVMAAKQLVARPPGVRAAPTAAQPPRPPSVSNVPQPYSYGNVLQSHNRQNEIAPAASRGAARSSPGAKQRDNTTFVNEVLNWTYESIANCSQFGPPSSLLQSVVAPVPVHFQGYNDYFNTFFPLMMLNAFETLAQGWIENQRGREKSYYLLCKSELPDFRADVKTAHFEAHLREVDLARQLHPKEDDVVFLVVQNRKDSFKEEKEMEDSKVYHVGLVTRFCRASGSSARHKEQHTVYHVSVQTRGNLSFSKNKQVKCVVVGSLVTTRREFRSLLLLSRSPLAKAIINPSYNDFCPRDLPVASESATSDMNDYNEGQKRAIETAYAMVKQHPGLPKICLIHGPPGTGKSKTIVGLLSRVLRENTRGERTARKTNPKIKPNRFLVCAPSNAAVDELMKKIIVAFKEKCQNRQEPLGNCGDIKLVRIGAEKAINSEVLGFSLDKQVQHRMKRKTADLERDIQKKKESTDRRLDELIRQRAMNKCGKRESQMIDDEFNRVSKEREHLASQLKEVRAHSQKVQAEIILESDIICCTLSASGGGLLESTLSRQGVDPFSCVIVDEAGQSCEVETLIPLIHRCNKLVLVGDPRQLPPTVKSVKAQENGYDQSLMARLHRHLEEQLQSTMFRSLPVVQLTVQYRMHPDICLFPSNYVYGRTLKTDRATEESRCSSDWPFQPYLIFDVGDGREERDNESFCNPQEVKLVMELIKVIKARRKDLGLRRIGIITPYSAQKKRIQRQLDQVFGSNSPGEVDTVDAFQGREKDCVIVTCVRANVTKGSIGFLASLQRLNVTITRARFSLFILGRLETLMENKDWNELIQDAHKRGAIIKTSEESYKRDALRILKLKPTVWCPTKAGTKTPALQPPSSSGKRAEPAKPREASGSPLGPAAGHAALQGSRGPQQAQGAQAVDSRRGSASTPMQAAAPPAAQERPRDPRRAGMAGRTEAKGKEQASKSSGWAAQSAPGSTPQQGHEVSSASRDQSSRAEAPKKPQHGVGHCVLPSTSSPSRARHEHRAAVPRRSSTAPGEGGHGESSRRSRDSHAPRRRSESTEHSSTKRRKTSH